MQHYALFHLLMPVPVDIGNLKLTVYKQYGLRATGTLRADASVWSRERFDVIHTSSAAMPGEMGHYRAHDATSTSWYDQIASSEYQCLLGCLQQKMRPRHATSLSGNKLKKRKKKKNPQRNNIPRSPPPKKPTILQRELFFFSFFSAASSLQPSSFGRFASRQQMMPHYGTVFIWCPSRGR